MEKKLFFCFISSFFIDKQINKQCGVMMIVQRHYLNIIVLFHRSRCDKFIWKDSKTIGKERILKIFITSRFQLLSMHKDFTDWLMRPDANDGFVLGGLYFISLFVFE